MVIEYRCAEGHYERLPALAAELVSHQVGVLVATGSPSAGLAAKAATTSIPIVFSSGTNPVKMGLVGSLSRPITNWFFAPFASFQYLRLPDWVVVSFRQQLVSP